MNLPEPVEDRILEILAEAPDRQAPRIEQLIADSPQHEAEILRWIATHPDLTDLASALDCESRIADDGLAPTIETPGNLGDGEPRTIGPYRIIQRLESGGMGTVYLAEQRSGIHRRVAIKLIKRGMDSERIVQRFRAERQALALMNHPSIARVFDAGTIEDDGRPYFVMEYVDGTPLTDYCDQHRLSLDARLQLFLEVCYGVQHAHQKGIVHRDLKPGNILVSVIDGEAVPKIIDFGLAKAMQPHLAEDAPFLTELGTVVGTLEYMSPEQASGKVLDIDAATDVYSLGVILYELLVGTLPFEREDLLKAGFLEAARFVCEVEPPRPSTRLSDHDLAQDSAVRRNTDFRNLMRNLRGDLDKIVMKALAKDRTRRYLSPSEFAADLLRFRHNEVVWVDSPSFLYRARKLVSKHRGYASVIAGLFVALTTLVVFLYLLQKELRYWQGESRTAAQIKQMAADERSQAQRMKADAEAIKQAAAREMSAAEQAAGSAKRDAAGARKEAAAARAAAAKARVERERADSLANEEARQRVLAQNQAIAFRRDRDEKQRQVARLAEEKAQLAATWTRQDRANQALRATIAKLENIGDTVGLNAWLAPRIRHLLALSAVPWTLDRADLGTRWTGWVAQAEWLLAKHGTTFRVLSKATGSDTADSDATDSDATDSDATDSDATDSDSVLRAEKLRALQEQLRTLEAQVPRILGRQRLVSLVRAQHTDSRKAWQAARAAIRADAQIYGNLELPELVGFVPLGRNRSTGLWEFWFVPSGRKPKWSAAQPTQPGTDSGAIFVLVPGTEEFMLGAQRPGDGKEYNLDEQATDAERPVHSVSVRPYLLAAHELSDAQWRRLAAYTRPNVTTAAASPLPASMISYDAVVAVLTPLGLRLPTEVQWEFACRARSTTRFATGHPQSSLRGYANVQDIAIPARFDSQPRGLLPIGSLRPNRFGFYDMHGNVREWCRDWYGSYRLLRDRRSGERIPAERLGRVVRGGHFGEIASRARSAFRFRYKSTLQRPYLGARPAREFTR